MDVIVNADDLGLSAEVNAAIFDLMSKNLVTSASLIANAPYLNEACAGIGEFPGCSFGVHLNVTEFRPLSPTAKLEPLLDEHGSFASQQIRQVSVDSSLASAIYEEFCAQIEQLDSRGIPLSHIDSHHYVHNIPRMLPILKKIQKKFRIPRVRLSRNIYSSREKISSGLKLKKAAYNFLLKRYLRTKTTQGFSDFKLFYECAVSGKVRHRSFEVVVHPGNPYYEADEVELLQSPWRETVNFPVELITDAGLP